MHVRKSNYIGITKTNNAIENVKAEDTDIQ